MQIFFSFMGCGLSESGFAGFGGNFQDYRVLMVAGCFRLNARRMNQRRI